ncbi:MAG: cytochrome b/b6 domain-containing protein [bacterium]
MFRLVYLLGFIGFVAVVVWAMRSQLIQWADAKQRLLNHSRDLSDNLRRWRSLSSPARLGTLMRFFYLATLLSVFILALTGFLPVIVFGQSISNVAMFLHLLLAPLFAIGLTALALFWAQRHRFDKKDWDRLRQGVGEENARSQPAVPNVLQKIGFWLILLLAVPVIVSTILMMSSLYGTAGQESLLHLHGYLGLWLLAVVGVHTYLVLANKG